MGSVRGLYLFSPRHRYVARNQIFTLDIRIAPDRPGYILTNVKYELIYPDDIKKIEGDNAGEIELTPYSKPIILSPKFRAPMKEGPRIIKLNLEYDLYRIERNGRIHSTKSIKKSVISRINVEKLNPQVQIEAYEKKGKFLIVGINIRNNGHIRANVSNPVIENKRILKKNISHLKIEFIADIIDQGNNKGTIKGNLKIQLKSRNEKIRPMIPINNLLKDHSEVNPHKNIIAEIPYQFVSA